MASRASNLPSHRNKKQAFKVICAGLAIFATQFNTAQAIEPAKQHFDIPAQTLQSALNQFSEASDMQMSYPAALTKGIDTKGVSGDYTPQEALNKLLAGSGLAPIVTKNNTVTLEKAANGSMLEKPGTTTLKAMKVTGTARQDVNDPYNEDYHIINAHSGTKTDTPLMQTPMSVQVIPRAVMNDQQVVTVEDALKNVTGVQNYQDFYVNPMIRGMLGDSSTFRNGLRAETISFLETANLQNIEVIKGATGLYGRLPAGGMVDMQTKHPQEQAYYSLQQQFGSYDTYRTTLDATGPILQDKSLLYRMNFAYKSNNSFRDYVYNDHVFVNPSLTWRPTDKFEVNANGEYQHDQFMPDNGVVAVGNRPLYTIPISSYLNDHTALQSTPSMQDRKIAAFDWNYKFNSDWKLTNRFKYDSTDYQQTNFAALTMLTPSLLKLGMSSVPQQRDSYATNLDLTGKFATGILQHSALLGYDYYNFNQVAGPDHQSPTPLLVPPTNIYNPYQTPINWAAAPINASYKSIDRWHGFYIQDQMTLWDKLHFMAGARWDMASYGTASGGGKPLDSFNTPTASISTVKPRFGLVYQPIAWASLYANYIQSVGLSNGLSSTGLAFAPEMGTQYEVGVKNEFFDKRLMTTLAFYVITKTNVLTPDPANPAFSIAIGEQHNQGMEYTVQGDVTKNISVIAGYSYIDAKISKANDGTQGNIFPNVAHNSGNIFGKYSFDNDLLRGFSVGTGVYLNGQRQGNVQNSFQLPGYARWDANATYSFKPFNKSGGKVTTQLNVYNILNQTYYNTALSAVNIMPGAPLTLMGSVRVEF